MTQITLFDLPQPETASMPKRISEMHTLFGLTAYRCCGQCAFLQQHRQGGTWYKCLKSDVSSGVATDWRMRWPACGLFEERYKTIMQNGSNE